MGLFGGTQVKTNRAKFSAETLWNVSVDSSGDSKVLRRATDSNKIEVIVLDDQNSRELRRIRTTGRVSLFNNLDDAENKYTWICVNADIAKWGIGWGIEETTSHKTGSSAVFNTAFEREGKKE